jgi:hypothetical protein
MPINKIGGGTALLPGLPIALSQGETFMLPTGQGILGTFNAQTGNLVQTGSTLTGQYIVNLGAVSAIQVLDAGSQQWITVAKGPSNDCTVSSDGRNFRLVNPSGTPLSAAITNAGSGLTNGYNTVAVTSSTGGSTWNTIVGGAINTTVVITTAGANYTVPPILVFVPPASQGNAPYILPTATCTLTSGGVGAVTVLNAGAGLVAAPTIQVIPQPSDTTGGGAVLTVNATLAGSGTLTYLAPNYLGTGIASAPTLTFVPASTLAATVTLTSATGAVDTIELFPF